MKPALEIAQIIGQFGLNYVNQFEPNGYIQKTFRALKICRTAELGGHKEQCDCCGHVRISYNSCRNRHCPKCQNTDKAEWIQHQLNLVVPVKYFHVVFTLPDQLNGLCIRYPTEMYNILFQSVWKTIEKFGYDYKLLGAQMGMTAVLHTWGQNLMLHPHLHCIVPGGGMNYKNQWINMKRKDAFLFPVKQLSPVFRGKFMEELTLFCKNKSIQLSSNLYKTNWVVYAKQVMAGPTQVVEYLGRYSHKIAISNHRLIGMTDKTVTFRYKDYKSDGKQKVMTLSGTEFLRRFALHILPKGFVRIRHYGILAGSNRYLWKQIQQQFDLHPSEQRTKRDWKTACRELLHFDPDLCPHCKKGKMKVIEIIEGKRPPPKYNIKKIQLH